jgi:dynein heavy chain 2
MRVTLDRILKQTLQSQGGLDIANCPSQICCLSEMINFSANCPNAIKQGKLANYKGDLEKQRDSYTGFDYKGNMLLFSKLKALILDIIHNIDVVDALMKDSIVNT